MRNYEEASVKLTYNQLKTRVKEQKTISMQQRITLD